MENTEIDQDIGKQTIVKAEVSGHPISLDEVHWIINGHTRVTRPTSCYPRSKSEKYCFSLTNSQSNYACIVISVQKARVPVSGGSLSKSTSKKRVIMEITL
ncbi:hypothetical protein Ciccas_006714 [Cichlidogyrus casuarinus]|uniref:Uncharacterized protein n=1 Tax=Cichlidogyrus casuarinus TaxID=1844966 RepID=A0ABD2Q565_9PLAT